VVRRLEVGCWLAPCSQLAVGLEPFPPGGGVECVLREVLVVTYAPPLPCGSTPLGACVSSKHPSRCLRNLKKNQEQIEKNVTRNSTKHPPRCLRMKGACAMGEYRCAFFPHSCGYCDLCFCLRSIIYLDLNYVMCWNARIFIQSVEIK